MASSDEDEGVLAIKHRKVAFIHSEDYVNLCDKLPKVQGRVSWVLIYGLLVFFIVFLRQSFSLLLLLSRASFFSLNKPFDVLSSGQSYHVFD